MITMADCTQDVQSMSRLALVVVIGSMTSSSASAAWTAAASSAAAAAGEPSPSLIRV